MATLTNSFTLIGTILTPFRDEKEGAYPVKIVEVETHLGKMKQHLFVTCYLKEGKQVYDFRQDLTGRQVIIEGYVKGKVWESGEKRVNYLTLIARKIEPISKSIDDGLEQAESEAFGKLVDNEDDLPF